MKQPTKFQRWFLGLFGGVPKSDYDFVIEQRDNFVGDLKINDSQIKKLKQENELLKKTNRARPDDARCNHGAKRQTQRNQKGRGDRSAAVRPNRVLPAQRGFGGSHAVYKSRTQTK